MMWRMAMMTPVMVTKQRRVEDMQDFKREEKEEVKTFYSSTSGLDDDGSVFGRGYNFEDDERYAHSSSLENPYPCD
ncbi:hypothetical protein LguiB_001626 [Lonicera macranthoides]